VTTSFDYATIKTPVIRSICLSYIHFYKERATCACDNAEGTWPNLFVDNEPRRCPYHEWEHRSKEAQWAIQAAGLSYPIPKIWNKSRIASTAKIKVEEYYSGLERNPLGVSKEPMLKPPSKDSSEYAGILARTMRDEGHIVFFVHHSQIINFSYSQRDQEVDDLILYAPVLVYWHNRDGRQNGRSLGLAKSRQYGYTFIVEE